MIEIRLMGGLGNQMLQYAALRSMMLDNQEEGIIDLSGITNKTHNVYSLNHFNISKNMKVIKNSHKIKAKFNYLIYGYYYVFLEKKKNGFPRLLRIQNISQKFGMYCVPDGYMELKKCNTKYKTMIGYFPSRKYFEKYEEIIRKELKVKTKVLKKNENLIKEIETGNSVCLHIRRGDYIGSGFEVCSYQYYIDAIIKMKNLIKKPKFFIFSDDISWVKKNYDFTKVIEKNTDIYFVEGNNPNYEELRLMYTCKHFILSNSTFSWWAQFLSDHKKKIVIAPSKWYQNTNKKCDLYEDFWIKIDV